MDDWVIESDVIPHASVEVHDLYWSSVGGVGRRGHLVSQTASSTAVIGLFEVKMNGKI